MPSAWGLVLAVALAAGCSSGGSSSAPPDQGGLNVVTTTTVFADIVRNVAGDRATVSSVIPPGVGPEDFEPRPDDARKLANARLIVSNGLGLDDFLDDLLASAGSTDVPRLVLGDGVPTMVVDGLENPHVWLDPSLVRRYYVPAILAALKEVDPAGAATYDANAASYEAALDDLDAELQARAAEVPEANRKLVTFHDAFPYFAEHFGFELVGVILENVGQEPTATELAELVERIRAAGATAVFSEAQFSPELTETLAEEAGVTRVVSTLYSDALGPAPADTYVGMMRWNMDQIVEALR